MNVFWIRPSKVFCVILMIGIRGVAKSLQSEKMHNCLGKCVKIPIHLSLVINQATNGAGLATRLVDYNSSGEGTRKILKHQNCAG